MTLTKKNISGPPEVNVGFQFPESLFRMPVGRSLVSQERI